MATATEKPLILSKYEKVQIIAARVAQLLNGAMPLLPEDERGGDMEAVAELELERRLLPMRVARRLPNGKVSVHALSQFATSRERTPKRAASPPRSRSGEAAADA